MRPLSIITLCISNVTRIVKTNNVFSTDIGTWNILMHSNFVNNYNICFNNSTTKITF
uniref:Candidate secreted effector n=1 Tax=Meloidogyne incognita TaxID=6306 RepID=A0A914MMD2_MELIC